MTGSTDGEDMDMLAGVKVEPDPIYWRGFRDGKAAAATEPRPDPALDVDALQRCPSLMVLLNRYGRFNGAWWDRLADEYAATRLAGTASASETP